MLWFCYLVAVDSRNVFTRIIRIVSLASGQSYDYRSASEGTLNDMDGIVCHQTNTKYNKGQAVRIFTKVYII